MDGFGHPIHGGPDVDQLFMLPPGAALARGGIPPARPSPPAPRARERRCPHPGCAFVTREGRARLEKHALTHGSERAHACDHPGCDKRFKTREHLSAHRRTHAETRAFRCERALCANHAAFKTRAEVALHAKRVHTLDKAEARELKMRAEMDALRARVDDAKAEGDVLRRAVDVLSAALKHAARRKRPRRAPTPRSGAEDDDEVPPNANANEPLRGALGDGNEGPSEEDGGRPAGGNINMREGAPSDARGDGGAASDARAPAPAPAPDENGDATTKTKPPRKAYTVSPENVLRAANQAAEAARAATEARWDAEEAARGKRR